MSQYSLFEEPPVARLDVVELFCDGGSRGNPGPAAIGAVLYDPTTTPSAVIAEISETIGVATNNVAEYTALLRGLERAVELGARRIRVRADSLLLIEQLKGNYKVKNAGLRPLWQQARELLRRFDAIDLQHVRREQNTAADALVNRALDNAGPGGR